MSLRKEDDVHFWIKYALFYYPPPSFFLLPALGDSSDNLKHQPEQYVSCIDHHFLDTYAMLQFMSLQGIHDAELA